MATRSWAAEVDEGEPRSGDSDRIMRRGPDVGFWVLLAGLAIAFIAGGVTVALGYWMLLPATLGIVGLLAVAAWRRVGRNFGTVSVPNMTPNLVLIGLPTTLAVISVSSSISRSGSAVLAVFVACLTFSMRPARSGRTELQLVAPCAILPALALTIVLRPNHPTEMFDVLLFVIGCVVTARAVYLSASKASALTSLIDGVGFFVVVSFVLWLAGITGTADRTEGLENALTGGERAIFPLSVSLAATPAMATVYLAAIIPILIVSRRYRVPRLVAAACAACVFALSESRVSLFGSVFLCASVLLLPQLFRKGAPWLLGVTMATPFIFGYIQDAFGRAMLAASNYLPWIIRPNEEASTLAGRDQIWSRAINFYHNEVDWIHQMIGYGTYGQAESGASADYYSGFEGYATEIELVTPHSSTLQILFDGGWLVGIALAVTIFRIGWVLSRSSSPINLAGLSLLVALSIVGISEVALSPSHAGQQPTWWVIVALSITVFSREREVADELAPHDSLAPGSLPSRPVESGGARPCCPVSEPGQQG